MEKAVMKPFTSKTEPSSSTRLPKIVFEGSLIKRLLTLIMVSGLAIWGTGAVNANELSNGLLDATSVSSQNLPTPTDWVVDSSRAISGPFFDGASSEGFANFAAPGGQGLFFKPFSGTVDDGNVTTHLYQDNPGAPGRTYTLTGYAGAGAGYVGVDPGNVITKSQLAIEFLDAGNSVIGGSTNNLKASGLGAANGNSFGYAQYMVMAAAPALTVTVRARVSIIDAFSNPSGGDQAFVADAFELTSIAPPGSPVITNQPVHQTVSLGANVTFTVGVSNSQGVSYEWQLNGTNLVNGGNISGAGSQTLTITGVSVTNVGHYRVLVSNGTGMVPSAEAALAIGGISFYPTVTIFGKIGDTYRVDYATALSPTIWIPMSTNIVMSSPTLVVDSGSPNSKERFYRAVYLP